ncbi:MAG: 23S rRNA (guanosine(2251)-2'-O)-methyltransferase RlmB [Micrococcales bacterium]
MASKGKRPGTAKGKKGPTVGSGGQRKKGLEGKGPTPKAEDRKGHKAFKGNKPEKNVVRKGEFLAPTARTAGVAGARRTNAKGMSKAADSGEVLSGRNSVLEALRAKVPATALYISNRIEMDERVKEALQLANTRQIPINEITKPEIDRLTGFDAVHQGIALSVPPYQYQHPVDLLDKILARGQKPLLVALDGITDPRNLGAIIRSVAAFGGQGVILPQRRSTGVTASAWKTSAGAAARTPVALAANLTATIKEYKKKGVFVVGLDGDGDMNLQNFTLGREPLLIVVGSEGKGLSRLVTENCDAIVSIPISSATESLNAGIAASVTLYEVSKLRAKN